MTRSATASASTVTSAPAMVDPGLGHEVTGLGAGRLGRRQVGDARARPCRRSGHMAFGRTRQAGGRPLAAGGTGGRGRCPAWALVGHRSADRVGAALGHRPSGRPRPRAWHPTSGRRRQPPTLDPAWPDGTVIIGPPGLTWTPPARTDDPALTALGGRDPDARLLAPFRCSTTARPPWSTWSDRPAWLTDQPVAVGLRRTGQAQGPSQLGHLRRGHGRHRAGRHWREGQGPAAWPPSR